MSRFHTIALRSMSSKELGRNYSASPKPHVAIEAV